MNYIFLKLYKKFVTYFEKNDLTIFIIIVFLIIGCNERTKNYELLVREPIGSPINYVKFRLNNTQRDIIKWNIYFNFFNDTIFHKNLTGKTTVGELDIKINDAVKLDSSYYREINSYIDKDQTIKSIVVDFDWYSKDTLIGLTNQSKLISELLVDSLTLDFLVYRYHTFTGNGVKFVTKYENTQLDIEKLKKYLSTNKNIDPWFKAEAKRRGYLD